MTTWILVSDVSRALLFATEKRDDDWSLVKRFEHPEGRELSSEIRPSSPPGRMQKSKASGTALRWSRTPGPKRLTQSGFEVDCQPLDAGLAKGKYADLVLVAPRIFWGCCTARSPARPRNIFAHHGASRPGAIRQRRIRRRLLDDVFPPASSSQAKH